GADDVLVTLVDGVIAHGLTLEVVGDRVDLQSVLVEQLKLALGVAGLVPAPRVEVVAPAGELKAVVAPLGRELGDFLERKVGPLAGEESDRSRHRGDSFLVVRVCRHPGAASFRAALNSVEDALDRKSTR